MTSDTSNIRRTNPSGPTEIRDLNQISASNEETEISTGVQTSNDFSPKEFEKAWSERSDVADLEDSTPINLWRKTSKKENLFVPDKHLFFDNRRGSYGAKLDIGDEYEEDVGESPGIKRYLEAKKLDPTGSKSPFTLNDGKRPLIDMLAPPSWARGHKGYVENGRRDLGIKIGDYGMPLMTKSKGAEFANQTHNDIINFYLRQVEAKDQMIDEFMKREESSFTFVNWDEDSAPQNVHRKFAKELAKAQVFYLDPMVARMIDDHADKLFEHGMKTQEWPTIQYDELAEFDNNVLIVSIGMDDFSRKTWPTVHWFHLGKNNRSMSKSHWENYYSDESGTTAHQLTSGTNGMVNMEAFTDDHLVRRPSLALIAHDFDDWGMADSVTAWNFDEEMWVGHDEEQRQAFKDEDIEHLEYKIALIRNQLRQQWLKNISHVQETLGKRVNENFAPPFDLLSRPSWATGVDNARVRCGIRALFDYVNRRATNFKEMDEIPIPYRRLKVTKRNAGKFGFDSKSWKPTIKIIDLPRKPHRPSKNTKSGRQLECQFIVESHWRNQFYPKDPITGEHRPAYLDEDKTEINPESHKRILIPTHIKGPEDKEFKDYNAVVYAVMGLEGLEEDADA